MRDVIIEESWKEKLGKKLNSASMKELSKFLRDEIKAGKRIYPAGKKIFNAFELTKFSNVRVVILGQDPYHGSGQAHGLSFSVKRGVNLPPSLQNIFKELHTDLGIQHPGHGSLEGWANQGVLLLNTCLTVEEGKAGSHQNVGWEGFTNEVLKIINYEKNNIVFIFWGKKAQDKGQFIDRSKHLVIESAHPSPFSAYNGFFGSKPFSRANSYLHEHNLPKINW